MYVQFQSAPTNVCMSLVTRFLCQIKLVKMPVSDKFGICKRTEYCTLIPSTQSLNLTRTNENPNGKIVTHTKQNITLDQIPLMTFFEQMQTECRRGNEKDNSERTNEPP